jgi:transposase
VLKHPATEEEHVKSDEEIMEILEAFDLTRSFRDAAELAGCSPNTVAVWVAKRELGELSSVPARRDQLIDPYLEKIEEWVDQSKGKVRADVAHDKLVALGYPGSERTTRRAVAKAKKTWAAGRRRLFRPWVPEPGMWFQFDWGDGPLIGETRTWLFCAWLAWSRFRVVIPVTDKTLPSLIACIDQALRHFGGVPTYALTDNERTVTTDHVARIPMRHPLLVDLGHHYGLSIATCVVRDPQSKGGSEATVRVAEADLVPTDANLLGAYGSFAELDEACAAFCDEVNGRIHRVTRRIPAEMAAEEQVTLHRLPARPFTACFGVTRTVGANVPVISFEATNYSVPHQHRSEVVWVRSHGDEVVITAVDDAGPVEVARHGRGAPGSPRYLDEHFGPAPEGPLHRTPRAASVPEAAFLAIGEGAALWLTEAGAAGVLRPRPKMANAVSLAALFGLTAVDHALAEAAVLGRFADGDLASIVAYQAAGGPGDAHSAGEGHSFQPGTGSWDGFGQ